MKYNFFCKNYDSSNECGVCNNKPKFSSDSKKQKCGLNNRQSCKKIGENIAGGPMLFESQSPEIKRKKLMERSSAHYKKEIHEKKIAMHREANLSD